MADNDERRDPAADQTDGRHLAVSYGGGAPSAACGFDQRPGNGPFDLNEDPAEVGCGACTGTVAYRTRRADRLAVAVEAAHGGAADTTADGRVLLGLRYGSGAAESIAAAILTGGPLPPGWTATALPGDTVELRPLRPGEQAAFPPAGG